MPNAPGASSHVFGNYVFLISEQDYQDSLCVTQPDTTTTFSDEPTNPLLDHAAGPAQLVQSSKLPASSELVTAVGAQVAGPALPQAERSRVAGFYCLSCVDYQNGTRKSAGGKQERGETHLQTMNREFWEETGFPGEFVASDYQGSFSYPGHPVRHYYRKCWPWETLERMHASKPRIPNLGETAGVGFSAFFDNWPSTKFGPDAFTLGSNADQWEWETFIPQVWTLVSVRLILHEYPALQPLYWPSASEAEGGLDVITQANKAFAQHVYGNMRGTTHFPLIVKSLENFVSHFNLNPHRHLRQEELGHVTRVQQRDSAAPAAHAAARIGQAAGLDLEDPLLLRLEASISALGLS